MIRRSCLGRAASSLPHLIWGGAETQWVLGQRHETVLAAAKAVNSQLQAKVNRRDVSEADLVKQALSEKDPEPGAAHVAALLMGGECIGEHRQ
jgi:hypothetical protein